MFAIYVIFWTAFRLKDDAPILGMSNPAKLSRAEFRVCILLARGLSVSVEDRWPSMPALSDELRRLAAPRRRRWPAVLGVPGGSWAERVSLLPSRMVPRMGRSSKPRLKMSGPRSELLLATMQFSRATKLWLSLDVAVPPPAP